MRSKKEQFICRERRIKFEFVTFVKVKVMLIEEFVSDIIIIIQNMILHLIERS